MVADPNERPPQIAFCVAGSARSFATPLVIAHLRARLITPLAPCGAEGGSRLFLLLKTLDTEKHLGSVHFDKHDDTSRTSLRALTAAIESPWIRPMIGEAVLLNGSGAYLGVGWDGSSALGSHALDALRQADDTLWQSYRASRDDTSSATNVSSSAASNAASNVSTNASVWGRRVRGRDEERLVLNALNVLWCAQAIERHESAERSGRSFDLVLFARPDIVYWHPIKPWCEWNFHLRFQQAIVCEAPGRDGFWITARQHLARLANQAHAWRTCTDSWSRRVGSGTHIRYSCRTKAEELLGYVLRVPAPPVELDWESCKGLGSEKDWSVLRQVQRSTTCPLSRRHHGGATTCERKARHVCEVVLSHAYDQGVYQKRTEGVLGGLPVATGFALRRAFGRHSNRSVSACVEATLPYDEAVRKHGADGGYAPVTTKLAGSCLHSASVGASCMRSFPSWRSAN